MGGCDCVDVGVILWVGVGVIAWVRKGLCGWDSLDCCLKVCTSVCQGRGEGWYSLKVLIAAVKYVCVCQGGVWVWV